MKKKLPWLKLHTQDVLADPHLSMCSLAANGLLLHLICYAHHGEPYGYLTNGGLTLTLDNLSTALAWRKRDIRKAWNELVEHGRLKQSVAGVWFIPRMVKDNEYSKKQSEYGRKGGNPTLKGSLNPTLNPSLKATLKPEQNKSKIKSKNRQHPPTPLQPNDDDDIYFDYGKYNSRAEMYEAHPPLKILHSCQALSNITLLQYLSAIRARDKNLNLIKACKEVVRKANLEERITKPGMFLDTRLGYYEHENEPERNQKTEKKQKTNDKIKKFAYEIVDFKREGDSMSLASLARMCKNFAQVNGDDDLRKAEAMAEDILHGKR